MELRIFTEPQQGATYDDLLRVAQKAEQLGFGAFFRSDHYRHMGGVDPDPGPTDAWLTLAALARETSRIRLGTLVTAATFRLPGPLAISVAQVDQMSGGRVELGLGTGWYETEHTAYGIPFHDTVGRFDRFAEQLEIIDGLLTTAPGATYSFSGEHYTLVDAPALPKPVQSPRPPFVLGGSGKRRSAELAARYADDPPRGEVVLVVAPPAVVAEPLSDEAVVAVRRLVEAGAKPRAAAGVVAELTGASANALYAAVSEKRASSS